MSCLVSIIIPVYNTEAFIEQCLQSCLSQNIKSSNYEIIIIDDGSTDNSSKIIKTYADKYSNIISISKVNEGVSIARNRGISIAKGKYITFVDSDDRISPNSLNQIISEINDRQNEVLILNSILFKDEQRLKEVYNFPPHVSGKNYSGIEIFKQGYLRGSVCGVIFQREFLIKNSLNFSEQMKNGEDSLFMSQIFAFSSSISHLNMDFYLVTLREGSASRSWNYKRIKELLQGIFLIEEYISQTHFSKDQLAIFGIKAYEIISNSIYHFSKLANFRKFSELRSIIKTSPLYPIKTYGATHFRFKIKLLNFSITLFFISFLIRNKLIKLK